LKQRKDGAISDLVVFEGFRGETIAEEVACDEAMIEDLEAGRLHAALRIGDCACWAIVIGKGEKIDEVIDVDRARSDGIEIVRRSSAGGSVVVGPGNLNVSVVAVHPPSGRDLHGAYCLVQGAIAEALNELGVPARFIPPGDIAIGDRKISGAAQASRHRGFLVHSTLLVSMDLAPMDRYLRRPAREPDYRASRAHREFVTTIKEAGYRLERSEIERMIAQTLSQALRARETVRTDIPDRIRARARELVRLRYGLDSWTLERIDHTR